MTTVNIGNIACGSGQPLMWIAGPCVIESHDLTLDIAEKLKELAERAEHSADLQGVVRQGQSLLRQVVSRAGLARRA